MNNFIVGISTGNKDVEMSAGEIECSVLNSEFINQCNEHGAQVIILPQQQITSINLKGIDGLIVTGGGDINPEMYNQIPDETIERVDNLRDSTEINIFKIFSNLIKFCRLKLRYRGNEWEQYRLKIFQSHLGLHKYLII